MASLSAELRELRTQLMAQGALTSVANEDTRKYAVPSTSPAAETVKGKLRRVD